MRKNYCVVGFDSRIANWHDWEKPYQSRYNIGDYILYYGFSNIPAENKNGTEWKTAGMYWYMLNNI